MSKSAIFIIFFCIVLSNANAQCSKYSFFANDSVGCENDIFSFKVIPTPPSGSVLNWDFEVKKVNNTANPTVAFTTQDTLTVQLEIKLPSSQTCQLERVNYIKIGSNPKIKRIDVSSKVLCNTGQEVELTLVSSTVKKATWSLEGSIYSGSSKTVKHKFTKTGYAQLQLIAEGIFGCTTKKIYDSILFVERKPLVEFPFTEVNLCGKSSINFKPEYTYYGQNSFDYSWVFQGASPATIKLAIPGRIGYPNTTGSFDVSLGLASKVSNCSYNYNFDDLVKVVAAPDLKLLSTSINGVGCKSRVYALQVTNTGLDPKKITWTHSHGDSISLSAKNGDSIIVSGNKVGTYTLFVSYDFGSCVKTASITVQLSSSNLVAQMERNLPCICNIPSQIFIRNRSVHYSSLAMNYQWTLANKKGKILANSTDTNFRWKADRYGNFNLNLKATGTDGCFEMTDYEFVARPFKVDFLASPSTACPNTEIKFELKDTMCFDAFDSVSWTLYNLDKTIKAKKTGDGATEKYKDLGWYNAQVIVKTKAGCIDTLHKDSAVHILNLSGISATVPKGPFCVGDEVKLKYSVSPKELAGDWYGVFIHKDTTIYSSLFDSIKFKPPLPGMYDVKVVFVTKECADSVYFSNALEVGGVLFDFSPAALSGCLPFTTNLKSSILQNTLVGTTNTSLVYEWGLSPQDKGSFADKNAKDGQLTVTKLGNIDITLAIENAQGCKTQLTKKSLFQFNLSASFNLPDTFCVGLEYPVENNSKGSIDSLWWSADVSGLTVLPNNNTFSPKLVFAKAGDYVVSLKVKDGGGCEEIATKKIHIIDFGFSFTVDNTDPKCSPAPFEFTISSTNIDSFVWNFDDGQGDVTTATMQYLKIYDLTRTAPYKNKFDVKLYAKNNIGCVDSIISKELLTVLGPVPNFEIVNPIGCEPHEVQFIDKSINAKKIYFDFGDNTSIDSVNYLKHVFSLEDSTIEFQHFRPFIVVKDNNDCQYSYRTPDTITVFSQPKARFLVDKKEGCDPEAFLFTDNSRFAYKWRWFFGDGDSLVDTFKTAKHSYNKGKYAPKLIVSNSLGCQNEYVLPNKIVVYKPPIAAFRALDTFTCLGREIAFKDSSQTDFKIIKWRWSFGENGLGDTSILQNPSKMYNQAGEFTVSLMVTDSNGCHDTLVKKNQIEIFNRLPVDSPEIRLVSVWNDSRIELEFKPSAKFGFTSYKIEELNFGTEILTSKRRKDTLHSFGGFFPDSLSYCFRVELTDKCGFTHPGDTHCTVLLGVDKSQKEVANLSWSPYIGWQNELSKYLIYRGLKNQAVFPLASVSATTLSYNDSSVCSEDYIYEVRALKLKDSLVSLSNQVDYKPEYVFQVNPLAMYLATVNNEDVQVFWQKSVQRNVKHYVLDRKANDNSWLNDWKIVTDTQLVDSFAKTQDLFYKYRVRAIDQCDYNSDKSQIATSILLNAKATERDFILTWNGYRKWPKGVSSYILQRKGPTENEFSVLAQLPGTDSSFTDTSAFLMFQDGFVYRVLAIENAEIPDSSFSNERHVLPIPSLFMPNAFSPNGDGVNDVFLAKSFALLPDTLLGNLFEMRIYNRWGQEVFVANSLENGWDGTFKGVLCEPEKYIYLLRAKAKNGTLFFRKGSLLLLR